MQVVPCLREALQAIGSTDHYEQKWYAEQCWVFPQSLV